MGRAERWGVCSGRAPEVCGHSASAHFSAPHFSALPLSARVWLGQRDLPPHARQVPPILVVAAQAPQMQDNPVHSG